MRIVVVGAGMYVTGRGTAGFGTVLPALVQLSKEIHVDEIVVCSTTNAGRGDVERAAESLNRRLAASVTVRHGLVPEVLATGSGRSRFDCAIVSVPDHSHLEVGRQVLDAGLHCLMVKPFTLSTSEGLTLIELAESRQLYGAVEFHKRYDESNLVVRRLISEGRIGSIAYVSVEYSQRISVPLRFFSTWASRTNVFQYLGVHYVDLIHFMTGCMPKRVLAAGHSGILTAAGVDTHDSIHVLLEWHGNANSQPGFLSQFAVGWIDPESSTAMSDQRYVVAGSKGRVDCDQKHRGITLSGAGGPVEEVNPYFSEYLSSPLDAVEFAGYGFKSIRRFVMDVRDLRNGDCTPADLEGRRPTFRSAMISTAVIQAARESLESGSTWRDVDAAL